MPCQTCQAAKTVKRKHTEHLGRATYPLGLVHTDIQGPLREKDYMDKESPTPSMAAVRLLFSIAAKRDYEVALIDVDTAFLNAAPNEAVHVSLPQGYP